MTSASRRTAAAVLPLTGLMLWPSAASASSSPPVDPERGTHAARDDYTGHVQVVRGRAADANVLTGTVFVDRNRNSARDTGERGVAGVTVSNGRDVVTTDGHGRYRLPAFDSMTVFVTQPAGYAVPVDEDNVAQFSYNHFPNGSPYGGVPASGPLPKAVNFPMVRSKATAASSQNCAFASDTQGSGAREINLAKQGAVRDLVDRSDLGGCGLLLLGDNAGGNPAMNDAIKDIYRQVSGPVRAVAGERDIDTYAPNDDRSLDTFRHDFGPTYYSYEVGQAHVVVLDTYRHRTNWPYWGTSEHSVTGEQLAWLRKDLANVPANKLLIVASHTPMVTTSAVTTTNASTVFSTLQAAGRTQDNTVLIGGHSRTVENHAPGTRRSEWYWAYFGSLPFRQLVAGSVSGGGYVGSADENDLPYGFASDGSRPGTTTLSLSGNAYVESYKVRQLPWSKRLSVGVNSPAWRSWASRMASWNVTSPYYRGPKPELGRDVTVVSRSDLNGGTHLTADLYLGSKDAQVEVTIDNRRPVLMSHTQPGNGEYLYRDWAYSDVPSATVGLRDGTNNSPASSSSLWRIAVPRNLTTGTHTARVTATDRHGRTYTESLRFTVTD